MEQYKSVGIKKLKNELSFYLREVKKGSVIMITDHGNVVAEIRTPGREYGQIKRDALKQEWIDSNKLFLPAELPKPLKMMSIQVPVGTAEELLDFERGDGK
ncbi:MAG: hypothetical protein DRP70_05980 [Spirochaetes bacterium]|nr:MAG: hypothetical protein DRP70_05980 [Spirochaetota bacterium]RKX98841.1 MAG: hypothetical protein DRZ90_01325 [Spirochaetota bacterium]